MKGRKWSVAGAGPKAWVVATALLVMLASGSGCKKSDTTVAASSPTVEAAAVNQTPPPMSIERPSPAPPTKANPSWIPASHTSHPEAAAAKPAALRLYWNVWAEDDGVVAPKIAGSSTPTIVLDLSEYIYQPEQAVAQSADLAKAVSAALSVKRRSLALIVRISLLGGGSSVELDASAEQRMSIDLEKLHQSGEAKFESDKKKEFAHHPGSIQPGLSRQYALGSVRMPLRIRANPDPCAQIAFTIWDAVDSRPLDHLVFTLSSRTTQKAGKVCGVPAVQGGLAAMSGALTSNGEAKTAAALYVFEYAPIDAQVRTRAILVDTGKARVYHWTIPGQLTGYLNSAAFQRGIGTARLRRKYDQIASELRNKFFPYDKNDRDHQSAAAFAALSDLDAKDGSPLLLARFIAASGKQIYAPLGILNANGAVKRKFAVLYPLPRENYENPGCIERWALGFPKTLSGASLEWNDATMKIPRDRATRIGDMKQLKCYLDAGETNCEKPPPSLAGSEALLLLAHHSEGLVWFNDDHDNLERMAIDSEQKVFFPGSVAILSTCSVLNSSNDNDRLMVRLNDYGMDAIIASPFAVQPEYGVLLSKKIIEVLASAYAANKALSVLEIFELAAAKISADPEYGPAFDEMRYEFVVLGNHRIKICQSTRY